MKNALIIAVIMEETLTTELVAEAADWQPYRVRAELKRLGVELTPVEAVKMVCRRNDKAVSQLVEAVRSMHNELQSTASNACITIEALIAKNKELTAKLESNTTIDALIARIDELEARNAMTEKVAVKAVKVKPSVKKDFEGHVITVSQLAEWAGVDAEELLANIEALPESIRDSAEYFDSMIARIYADRIVDALGLEKKQ